MFCVIFYGQYCASAGEACARARCAGAGALQPAGGCGFGAQNQEIEPALRPVTECKAACEPGVPQVERLFRRNGLAFTALLRIAVFRHRQPEMAPQGVMLIVVAEQAALLQNGDHPLAE